MRRVIFFVVYITLAGVLLGSDVWARNNNHVRVVLDLSMSLSILNAKNGWPTDPDRLLLLSTELLYDLVNPNTTTGDSFVIYPFDTPATGATWKCVSKNPVVNDPANPIPQQNIRKALDASKTNPPDNRMEVLNTIKSYNYDAPCTYFTPGIKRAIGDLKGKRKYDRKIIFLLTDGIPDNPDESKVLKGLVNELKKHRILLYVLGFGPQASNPANSAIFNAITKDVGGMILLPDNKNLLIKTAQIFADSFGYSMDSMLPDIRQVNLEANKMGQHLTPEDVAVVVFSHNNNTPPSLDLTPPATGKLTLPPNGFLQADGSKSSYSLQWVLKPDEGFYGFKTNINRNDGTVVVLRRTPLQIDVRSVPPNSTQILKTIALVDFPLAFRVSPKGGKGVPPDVDLWYVLAGQTTGKFGVDLDCKARYLFCEDEKAATDITPTPEGIDYKAVVTFPVNQDSSRIQELYAGHIEVSARIGSAEVGSLIDQKSHRIEVHPPFDLYPLRSQLTFTNPITKGPEQCDDTFTLQNDAPVLPKSNAGNLYRMEIGIDLPANKLKALSGSLRGAELTITDTQTDQVIASFSFGGDKPPAPYAVNLSKDQLTGREYKLCFNLQNHNPKPFSPSEFKFEINFIFNKSPYNEPDFIKLVTKPISVDLQEIDVPNPVLLIALAILALLALLALLWYTRIRPSLPDDLGYSISSTEMPKNLNSAFKLLDEISPLRKWFGLIVEKPVFDPAGTLVLAWIRPSSSADELYTVRLEKGITLGGVGERDAFSRQAKLNSVEIYRTYQLNAGAGSYLFRLEYDDKA